MSAGPVSSDTGSPQPPESKEGEERTQKKKKKVRFFTAYDTEDDLQYWVPRIHLAFAAEDPAVFAQRVSDAYQLRKEVESHLRSVSTTHFRNPAGVGRDVPATCGLAFCV